MKKVKEYMIVRSHKYELLVKEVNEMIGHGFQPHGSLAAAPDDYFYQPMVKIEKTERRRRLPTA